MVALCLPSLHLFFYPSSSFRSSFYSPYKTPISLPKLCASLIAREEVPEAEEPPLPSSLRGVDRKPSSIPEGAVTPLSVDFNAWYLDVIAKAELADYGPVRGTMVIRPYGYAIWEAIQEYLNAKFKETGHSNMYFPQFIPYSFIEKEASHVEGFSPELAVVTIGGGKELEEKLVVRPTSETIVNHMFTQWIQSYRDLPIMINQWANVTRWEMRTKPFIRTLEFLWQEGHTAHATAEEAEKEALQMIDVYKKFAYEQAAIPVIAGRKSKAETFAGASCTYTIEAMMGDRKALQAGTSHNLGQNFSRAFETQVVIVPIWKKGNERIGVLSTAASVEQILKSAEIKVKIDNSEQRTPGWKFNFWEMKGVPVRIEIGPRDVANGSVVVSRRDVPGKLGKDLGISMEPSVLIAHVKSTLEDVQASLLRRATLFRDRNIVDVSSYEELKEAISQGKWARGPWSASLCHLDNPSDVEEQKVKEETGATIRCFPFDQPEGSKVCFMTGNPAEQVAIFARSY
ncbi:prolyl-tRNA synthetase [Dendrobium catenatum]|uniref:proline--tRNA ligase n=1 Tax=Dendrobium catenatum TaxID=906689 RepID=A0A2I0W1W4_9ASPA|nr:prolyl-tRNA synthetase [Dendrobium catenatum]